MNRSLIGGVIFAAPVCSAVALAQGGKAPARTPAVPSSSAAAASGDQQGMMAGPKGALPEPPK